MTLFFFNDTATTEIYTLSLHDALPIFPEEHINYIPLKDKTKDFINYNIDNDLNELFPERPLAQLGKWQPRSEEHTSELQSRQYLVCRLLLEKKTPIRFLVPSSLHLATS